MKKVRPTKQEQVEVVRTQGILELGFGASIASDKTGYNIKTVCKYYNQWTDEIIQSEQKDFVEREKDERERIRLSLDALLFEEFELLDEIKQEIAKYRKKDKEVPRYLVTTQIEILRNIFNITEKKGYFAMKIPLDESVQKMIEEKFDANSKQRN
jgi:hypothetical protein